MKRKLIGPTLVQVILWLQEKEPAFSGVNREDIERSVSEFNERQAGKLGEYLVAHGTLTQSQLDTALAEQAHLRGEYDKSIEHLKKAIDDVRAHERILSQEKEELFEGFERAVNVLCFDN